MRVMKALSMTGRAVEHVVSCVAATCVRCSVVFLGLAYVPFYWGCMCSRPAGVPAARMCLCGSSNCEMLSVVAGLREDA